MEFWYTEEWTENVRFSIKVDQQLYSKKSDFQQVDIFESQELGKFLTLDGLMKKMNLFTMIVSFIHQCV